MKKEISAHGPDHVRQFDVFRNSQRGCWTLVLSTEMHARGMLAVDCIRSDRNSIDDVRVDGLSIRPQYRTWRHVPIKHFKEMDLVGRLDDISIASVRYRLTDLLCVTHEQTKAKLKYGNAFSYGTLSYVCQHAILTSRELARGLGCSESTVHNIRHYLEVCQNNIVKTLRYYYADRPINLSGLMSKTHIADLLGEMLSATVPYEVDLMSDTVKNLRMVYMFIYIYREFGSFVSARVFGMSEDEVKYANRILTAKYHIGG